MNPGPRSVAGRRAELAAMDERLAARRDAAMVYLRDAHAEVARLERELAQARQVEDRCAAQASYYGTPWTAIGEAMGLSDAQAWRRAHATAEEESPA